MTQFIVEFERTNTFSVPIQAKNTKEATETEIKIIQKFGVI